MTESDYIRAAHDYLALFCAGCACSVGAGLGLGHGPGLHVAAAAGAAVLAGGLRYRRVGLAGAWTSALATLALQSVVLVELGVRQLRLPLPSPWQFAKDDDSALTAMAVVTLSAFGLCIVAFALTGTRAQSRRVRTWSYRLAPVVMLGSALLVLLGAKRLGERPTPERYFSSLNVVQTLRAADEEPCERTDSLHASAREDGTCFTPEHDVGGMVAHYHCRQRCSLYFRQTSEEGESPLFVVAGGHAEEVRWDPNARAWVWGRPNWLQVVLEGRGKARRLSDLSAGLSASRSWTVLAATGLGAGAVLLGLAVGCAVLFRRLRLEPLLPIVRGHVGAIAVALVILSNALLFAALIEGFLT